MQYWICLLLSVVIPVFSQAQIFSPAVAYSVGPTAYPEGVAVADVNGDGRQDIITANINGNSVSVLLGNGNGTFQTRTNYSAGVESNPYELAIADVNGDNRPDVITANSYSGTVGVLLGNGDGTFKAVTTYAAGKQTESVAVADINGDNKPDIITANSVSSTIGVLLGNGNGTFQAVTAYRTGDSRSSPYGVAVADINGDGRSDIVFTDGYYSTVGVLLGNGNGTFQAITTYATGFGPGGVDIADVNGDNWVDIVTANWGDETAGVLLGNGNGTFRTVATYSTGDSRNNPLSVKVADFNGDGRPDIVTTNFHADAVGVLLGKGNGTFLAVTPYATGSGSGPWGVAVADVNGDKKLDIVTANYNTGTAGVLLNQASLVTSVFAPLTLSEPALFPNPASTGEVILKATGLSPQVHSIQVAVVDALGHIRSITPTTATRGTVRTSLSTTGLAAGMYIVQLTTYDAWGKVVGTLPTRHLMVR